MSLIRFVHEEGLEKRPTPRFQIVPSKKEEDLDSEEGQGEDGEDEEDGGEEDEEDEEDEENEESDQSMACGVDDL